MAEIDFEIFIICEYMYIYIKLKDNNKNKKADMILYILIFI